MEPIHIFVSYAHEDGRWLCEDDPHHLIPYLRATLVNLGVTIWADPDIPPFAQWREEIFGEIDKADIALLLVSPYFIASDFIISEELPRIKDRRDRGELVVAPVLVSRCEWQSVELIEATQLLPGPQRTLLQHTENDIAWDEARASVAEAIRTTVKRIRERRAEARGTKTLPQSSALSGEPALVTSSQPPPEMETSQRPPCSTIPVPAPSDTDAAHATDTGRPETPPEETSASEPKQPAQPQPGNTLSQAAAGVTGLLRTIPRSAVIAAVTLVILAGVYLLVRAAGNTHSADTRGLEPAAGTTARTTPALPERVPSDKPWLSPGTDAGDEITGPDGGVYVWVTAGSFTMGTDGFGQRPAHRVEMDGFWLSKHEVTNAQYRAFCQTSGREFPSQSTQGDDHPVCYVNWHDASAYCEHYGLALPTEAQWEYAATGPENRVYPWGHEWDPGRLCWRDNQGPGGSTFPVGSFASEPSWCGALDMTGNVLEWCADWWGEDYYTEAPAKNPPGPKTGTYRVLRGGSWSGSRGKTFTIDLSAAPIGG